jgi:hypothetical protein
MLKMFLAAVTVIACHGNAFGFGTVNMLGQQAEHEQITRTALGCHSNNSTLAKEGLCFQSKSLDELAGTKGRFGAVGAPDNPANRELNKSEAHCDNSKLLECRAYIHTKINLAVAAARPLLRNGRIDDSQIPTRISCTYLRQRGRAKCNVLELLGSALHAAQDFYAHSNWADEAAPGPITKANPRGLNRPGNAPILNIRLLAPTTVPEGLISGCFIPESPLDTRGDAKCTVPSHADLNKDTGTIDPERFGQLGDPTLTTARTARGRVGTNFHKAVAGAVLDTRDKIRILRERLIATYGAEKGSLMFCALTHDNPKATCR